MDVSISTSGSTNECTILDTVRAYDTGGELLGPGLFTIEVLATQVVYTVSEEMQTIESITALVENGYNRGRGGRVRFRSILQENDAFANVMDLDVLQELGSPMPAPTPAPTTVTEAPTNAPSASPTSSPSSSPTLEPSLTPSQMPSQIPSLSPSISPSTLSPSNEPSGSPSASPTNLQAGVVPTNDQPSSAPSVVAAAAAASSDKTPPYVIAAIVLGSWAVLMACCFSIFLCRKNKKENDEQHLLTNGRPSEDSTPPLRGSSRHPDRQSGETSDFSTLPIVPNVVLADDDHRSLANTTLGEQTAGRKPPKKKRLVDTGISINSFEDESLYTSPIGIIPRIQPGRQIDEDEDDADQKRPPMLGARTAFEHDIFFPDTGSSSQESWSMPPSPVASKIGGLVAAELGPVSGDVPEALPSEQGSQYTESRDDVDGMIGAAPWPTQQLSPRSSNSSFHSSLHSSDTLKAQNVAATIALSTAPMATNEEHPIVDAPGTYERSGSSSLLTRKKIEEDKLLTDKEPTKYLLETHKEECPTSPEKEQSPMQMLEDEDMKTDVSPIDLQDSDSAIELRQSSSSERPPRLKSHPWQSGKSPRTPNETPPEGQSGPRTVSPYKMRYLEGLQSPAAQRELQKVSPSGSQSTSSPLAKNTRPEPVVLPGHAAQPRVVTPPSEMLPAIYDVKRGDQARKNALESPPPAPLTEGDLSVLTTSSSGTSTEDPWLFDSVAHVLGPRSTSADMESLSGKSNKSMKSTKSGKSWRSHRSARSLGSRRHGRKRRKGSSVGSRGTQPSSFSFGAPDGSSEFSLAPRSLENDLRRLEEQLASLQSPESKKEPQRVPPSPPGMTGSSNSVTASSMSSSWKVSAKQKIIVVAPPGKLGVVLANRHNGTGTVVSELRGSSPLRGALFPGDKLCKFENL